MSPACFFISSFKIKLHLAFTSWLKTFWASFCCSRVLPGNISRLKLALLHCRKWDCPRWVGSARRCTFNIGWRTFRAWSIPSPDLPSPSASTAIFILIFVFCQLKWQIPVCITQYIQILASFCFPRVITTGACPGALVYWNDTWLTFEMPPGTGDTCRCFYFVCK